MLAYAANRPDPAGRRSSPNVMLFIVAAHIAAIAALMSYRMDLPQRLRSAPLVVDLLRDPPPQPQPVTKSTPIEQTNEWLTNPQPKIPTEPIGQRQVDLRGTPSADPGPIVGPSIDPVPLPQPQPKLTPVRVGPQLLTPASQLRPPYPASKLLNEEEAVLRLRLSIGADGHVTAVDPIGRVDGVFLDAARRYLIAHWRYRPGTVDGRGIATTTEITLSFQLDS